MLSAEAPKWIDATHLVRHDLALTPLDHICTCILPIMARFPVWTLAAALFPALASCVPHRCPSPAGDLTVSAFQLYPENADFDTKRCVAYFR